jgi:hypothetical protein
MTQRNAPIGEVECPVKKCTRTVPVFRFRPRPNERMQRFANKLYCKCPAHGRFGGDGDEEMQLYLEENSRKCPSESAGNAGKETPATPAAKTPKTPQELPATPAATAPARPAAEPALPAKKSFSWFGLD